MDKKTHQKIVDALSERIMGIVLEGHGSVDPIWASWATRFIEAAQIDEDPLQLCPPWLAYAACIAQMGVDVNYFPQMVEDRIATIEVSYFAFKAMMCEDPAEARRLEFKVLKALNLIEI